jgi:branched-chain amino acid transport system substrate-binding protein
MSRCSILRAVAWILLSLLIVLTPGLAGCSWRGNRTIIRIVTSFPMQGVALGRSVVNAVQMAVDERDSQVAGFSIELLVLDDGNESGQWDPDLEAANARQAVDDPLTVAYIGPLNSGAARVSIPITNQANLVQISPTNTWPGFTKVGFAPSEPGIFYPTGRRTYFRTCPTDEYQAQAAARWAESLGFRTVFILDDGEAYGKGLAELFEETAYELELEVLGHVTIDKMADDYRDVLEQVAAKKPDLVYFGGYTPNGAPTLVRQMREMGLDASFMGPDAIVDSAFIAEAGEAAEGVYATLVGVPPSGWTEGQALDFAIRYRERFGAEPEAFSDFAYDAASAVLTAIEEAGTRDRRAILDAMTNLGEMEGAGGRFAFDTNGDTTITNISGNVVRNGMFEYLGTLAP